MQALCYELSGCGGILLFEGSIILQSIFKCNGYESVYSSEVTYTRKVSKCRIELGIYESLPLASKTRSHSGELVKILVSANLSPVSSIILARRSSSTVHGSPSSTSGLNSQRPVNISNAYIRHQEESECSRQHGTCERRTVQPIAQISISGPYPTCSITSGARSDSEPTTVIFFSPSFQTAAKSDI